MSTQYQCQFFFCWWTICWKEKSISTTALQFTKLQIYKLWSHIPYLGHTNRLLMTIWPWVGLGWRGSNWKRKKKKKFYNVRSLKPENNESTIHCPCFSTLHAKKFYSILLIAAIKLDNTWHTLNKLLRHSGSSEILLQDTLTFTLSQLPAYLPGVPKKKEKRSIKLRVIIQWNLFITRSLGPWKLPCYIRFLIISG